MSHLFPIKPTCFWLVIAFLFVFGSRLRPWCIFVPDFFPSLNSQQPGRVAVGICVAGVNLHANQWWWRRWQRANGGGGGGDGNAATK
jgi:hypothetical protein